MRKQKMRKQSQSSYNERQEKRCKLNDTLMTEIESIENADRTLCHRDQKVSASNDQVSQTLTVEVEDYSNKVLKELHHYQTTGAFCDVVMNTKDGHVKGHKVMLMAASPQLYDKLNTPGPHTGGGDTNIDLLDIPYWALQNIVTFIYTGKVELQKSRRKEFSQYCRTLGLSILEEKITSQLPLAHRPATGATNKTENDFIEALSLAKKVKPNLKRKSSIRAKGKSKQNKNANDVKVKHDTDITNGNSNEMTTSQIENTENVRVEKCHVIQNNKCKLKDNERNEKTRCKLSTEIQQIDRKTKFSRGEIGSQDTIELVADSNDITCTPCNTINTRVKHADEQNKKIAAVYQASEDEYIPETGDGDTTDDRDTDSDYEPAVKRSKTAETSANNDKCRKKNDFHNDILNQFEPIQCKICKETLDTPTSVKKHKKVCKIKPRKRCVLCQISFKTTEEYTIHRKTDEKCLAIRWQKHQKEKQRRAKTRNKYGCIVCPRKFRSQIDSIDHEFMVHELPYDKERWPDLHCEYCGYWTMNPLRLHRHTLYDCSRGQEYICDVCGNKYKNEKSLSTHKDCQHNDVIPMLPCDQCGKTLKGPNGLKRHIMIMHKGENPSKHHMCHICSKKYRTSNDLTFHLHREHNQPLPDGYKIYQCEECDYIINSKRTYEKHKLLHQDRRDFCCEICPKTFKTKNSLHCHKKLHNSKKTPCPYEGCSYASLKKFHMKLHIENQHTQKGVKHEQCHLCSYSTFFKGNLNKHLRSVHQLEVVTRYSVQMKARYKNLKSGHIVGQIEQSDKNKTKKKSESKSDDSNSLLMQPKSNKVDKSLEKTGMDHFNESKTSNDQIVIKREIDPGISKGKLDHLKGVIQNDVKSANSIQIMDPGVSIPSGNPTFMYGLPNMPESSSANNGVYKHSSEMAGSYEGSMPRQMPGVIDSLREVNLGLPSVFTSKSAVGVAPPIIFQPSGPVGDDGTNASKMITYFQM